VRRRIVEHLVGIDIGTTGTKSALFGVDGTLIDKQYKQYPVLYPRQGWAEQNPEDWWDALVETVRALVSKNDAAGSTVAMSLSTQGGCLVLLDNEFRPLCPAVSWMDTRAGETSGLLMREITPEELYRMCGWPVIQGLGFPTVFWFRQKKRELFNKARYFASTIDYLNYRLTGKFCIDFTNLALMGFLDLEKRDICEKTLGIDEIKRENIAEIVPSGKRIGTLTENAAYSLGLHKEVIVVSGAHDQYCANIGTGSVHIGNCVLDAGTSWVLLAISDRLQFSEKRLRENQGLFGLIFPGIHPASGKYGLMTVVPFGSNSLNWYRQTFRPDRSFEQLSDDAAKVTCGSGGLLYIPIASSRSGGGAFLGVDASHTIDHYTRAVFEGVVLATAIHRTLIEDSGLTINSMRMIGGGARSSLWPQIVADVLDMPVDLPEQRDAECAGAAILAGGGAGVVDSIEEGCMKFRTDGSTLTPVISHTEVYDKLYKEFERKIGII
jgi:xylulokinase